MASRWAGGVEDTRLSHLAAAVRSLFAHDRRPRILIGLTVLLLVAALALAGVFWAFQPPSASAQAIQAKADAEMMWEQVKDLKPLNLIDPFAFRPQLEEINAHLRIGQTAFDQKDFRPALAAFRDVIDKGQQIKDQLQLDMARSTFDTLNAEAMKAENPAGWQKIEAAVAAAEAAARERKFADAVAKYREAMQQGQGVPGRGVREPRPRQGARRSRILESTCQGDGVGNRVPKRGRRPGASGPRRRGTAPGGQGVRVRQPGALVGPEGPPGETELGTPGRRAVPFLPDGRLLVSGDLHVFDTETGTETPMPQTLAFTSSLCLAVAPDGQSVAVGLAGMEDVETKVFRVLKLPGLAQGRLGPGGVERQGDGRVEQAAEVRSQRLHAPFLDNQVVRAARPARGAPGAAGGARRGPAYGPRGSGHHRPADRVGRARPGRASSAAPGPGCGCRCRICSPSSTPPCSRTRASSRPAVRKALRAAAEGEPVPPGRPRGPGLPSNCGSAASSPAAAPAGRAPPRRSAPSRRDRAGERRVRSTPERRQTGVARALRG